MVNEADCICFGCDKYNRKLCGQKKISEQAEQDEYENVLKCGEYEKVQPEKENEAEKEDDMIEEWTKENPGLYEGIKKECKISHENPSEIVLAIVKKKISKEALKKHFNGGVESNTTDKEVDESARKI